MDRTEFPFTIPAVGGLDHLDLSAAVTYFVGENGSGKSTVLEALAVAAGLNAEGGSRHLRFSNRPTESGLHSHLRLQWAAKPEWAFFLRAETFFNTATAYESIAERAEHFGVGLHERSHGEQFMEAAERQFSPGGLHLLDEPEAALSIIGQLRLLRCLHEITEADGQFIIATHSPVLLAFPGARIYCFDDQGVAPVEYEECAPYQLTKSFLDDPERFFRHLFD